MIGVSGLRVWNQGLTILMHHDLFAHLIRLIAAVLVAFVTQDVLLGKRESVLVIIIIIVVIIITIIINSSESVLVKEH